MTQFIDHNTSPTSFNDPNQLKTYIDNKIHEAREFQNSELKKQAEKPIDRKVMSNQESYRKVLNTNSLISPNTGVYSSQGGITQTSFYKKPGYNPHSFKMDIMRQNAIIKINPNSKHKLLTTHGSTENNNTNFEEIPDIEKKGNIVIGRVPLKTTKRRNLIEASSSAYATKINTNRSLETD